MRTFPSSFEVNNKKVGGENPCLIIAEAGVSHFGNVSKGYDLVDLALDANADIFKMQHYKTEDLVSDKSSDWFKRLKEKELTNDEVAKIKEYCDQNNITFLCTAHDKKSLDFLDKELDVPAFKIGSGEVQNWPFIADIASRGKPVILSTGMSKLGEVGNALNILINAGTSKDNITVLHANTMYPTPMEDVNLNAMLTIQKEFGVDIGYSDHTLGIEVDIAAVAMGASCIEKHFTLDKTMDGPDHKASLDSEELKAMVVAIRNIEKALGSSEKKPSPSESVNIDIVRKSIVANQKINKGDILTDKNITIKRPGKGISPMQWDEVIGAVAVKNYKLDDLI